MFHNSMVGHTPRVRQFPAAFAKEPLVDVSRWIAATGIAPGKAISVQEQI
jgi:hypothetical protein